MLTGCFRFSDI